MKMSTTITGYPFVPHVDQTKRPTISRDYVLGCYANKTHSQLHNLHSQGVIKIMGYRYDCRPLLTKFLVKQYGSWYEVYAPNRTALRCSIYGRIEDDCLCFDDDANVYSILRI